MNRFRTLLIAAAAAFALAACSDMVQVPSGNSLEVGVYPVHSGTTKTAIDGTVFPNDRTMKVSAYYNAPAEGTSGNYFSNVTYSRFPAKGDKVWAGGSPSNPNPKYWPSQGTLDLFAYSADGLSCAALAYVPTYTADVSRGVTLTVADNSAVQSDILFGRAAAQTHIATGNPMTFRHAEALLAFTAKSNIAYNATANTGIVIRKITVTGAKYQGTLVIDAMAAAGAQCTWTLSGSATPVDLPTNTVASVKLPYNVPTTAMDVTASAANHMGIGGFGVLVPEQSQTGFVVEYELHNGKDDAGNAITNVLTFAHNCEGEWLEGRKYVYELAFDLKEITVTPTVTDWNNEYIEVTIPHD